MMHLSLTCLSRVLLFPFFSFLSWVSLQIPLGRVAKSTYKHLNLSYTFLCNLYLHKLFQICIFTLTNSLILIDFLLGTCTLAFERAVTAPLINIPGFLFIPFPLSFFIYITYILIIFSSHLDIQNTLLLPSFHLPQLCHTQTHFIVLHDIAFWKTITKHLLF